MMYHDLFLPHVLCRCSISPICDIKTLKFSLICLAFDVRTEITYFLKCIPSVYCSIDKCAWSFLTYKILYKYALKVQTYFPPCFALTGAVYSLIIYSSRVRVH
uniref:Uncharacterized protein n=1 Tax=Schistocephalus solidus TaxID=70667 RepID=A0A0V0JA21_SCHSO